MKNRMDMRFVLGISVGCSKSMSGCQPRSLREALTNDNDHGVLDWVLYHWAVAIESVHQYCKHSAHPWRGVVAVCGCAARWVPAA